MQEKLGMRQRWRKYALIGLVFGVLDWYFLDFLRLIGENNSAQLESAPFIVQIIGIVILVGMNWGIWLVPVIPAAIYEIRQSGVIRKAALASVIIWSAGILSYYTFYTAILMFTEIPHMDHMRLSNSGSPGFWQDWMPTFRQVILGQFIDWIGIAVIGGSVVGAVTATVYKRIAARRTAPAIEETV